MHSLEKNNQWVSDGTYLAFKYFMNVIVPEYIIEGIDNKSKEIYVELNNMEDGVHIRNYNLGKINYQEFILYLYGLASFSGFKVHNLNNVLDNYNVPFDLKRFILDYYEELQTEEYLTYSKTGEQIGTVDKTYLAYKNFIENIIKEILDEALEGIYKVSDILDTDGTIISRLIYIPLEIRHNEFFLGNHNLGRINALEFLNYLTSMSAYTGMVNNELEQEITFNIEQLIMAYKNQTFSR